MYGGWNISKKRRYNWKINRTFISPVKLKWICCKSSIYVRNLWLWVRFLIGTKIQLASSIRSWKKESWCMHWFLSFFSVSRLASSFCSWCQLVELFLLNTEVKHQVYVKRPTQIRTTWPTFLFTSRLLFYAQISSFAQFFIHKNCFWALLSTLFLFWEIFNSNWTFPVRRIREAKTL